MSMPEKLYRPTPGTVVTDRYVLSFNRLRTSTLRITGIELKPPVSDIFLSLLVGACAYFSKQLILPFLVKQQGGR